MPIAQPDEARTTADTPVTILDPGCVHADQERQDMILQIACHRQFPPVERAVAIADDTVAGHDLDDREIPPR